jgi:hypothetical protein
MKKTVLKISLILIIALSINCVSAKSQDSIDNKMKLLDLKMQLIDSKLELLDSKIKMWERKPEELDIKLAELDNGFSELDSKMTMLDFDPENFNYKFSLLDSMVKSRKKDIGEQKIKGIVSFRYDTVRPKLFKSVISLNPERIFEGTFQLSFEKAINPRNSVDISGLATYATDEGISRRYLLNQTLSYYNDATDTYDPYTSKNIYGFGSIVQWKNYLLASVNPKHRAPVGLYAGPSLMYRRLWINGTEMKYIEGEFVSREITQKLNVFAGGVIIGTQISFIKTMSLDIYVGGVMRLCIYDNETEFTKYKKWDNIDFSGVLPAAGVKIGILK